MADHIYELRPDLDYVGLTFVDARNFIFPYERRFETLCRMAMPLEVELNDENARADTDPVPDFPHFSVGECCFSLGAWAAVSDVKVKGKTARLAYNDGKKISEFVLLEPPSFDCLDFDLSDVQFFDEARTRVKWVENIVLRNVAAIDVDIFKVRHVGWTVFCTEKCKRLIVKNQLTGFEFRKVPVTT